jgi:hypothetical protein
LSAPEEAGGGPLELEDELYRRGRPAGEGRALPAREELHRRTSRSDQGRGGGVRLEQVDVVAPPKEDEIRSVS